MTPDERVVFGRTPNGREVVSYGRGLWFIEQMQRGALVSQQRVSIHRAARACGSRGARTGLRGGERFDHFVRLGEAKPSRVKVRVHRRAEPEVRFVPVLVEGRLRS